MEYTPPKIDLLPLDRESNAISGNPLPPSNKDKTSKENIIFNPKPRKSNIQTFQGRPSWAGD